MASIPKRVEDRISAGVKKYQPVLAQAKSRDINEADTAIILNNLLAEVFGYAKYIEITSERDSRLGRLLRTRIRNRDSGLSPASRISMKRAFPAYAS